MTASADYLAMATDKKHQAEKLRRQAAGLDDEAVSLREKYDSSPGVVKARETASLLSKRKASTAGNSATAKRPAHSAPYPTAQHTANVPARPRSKRKKSNLKCAYRFPVAIDGDMGSLWKSSTADHPLAGSNHRTGVTRIVRLDAPTNEFLVYVGGRCIDDGRAGCAVVYGTEIVDPENGTATQHPRTFSFALEEQGPTGESHEATDERAVLRAVIGALECRKWNKVEGFGKLTLATVNETVYNGMVQWMVMWREKGWRTRKGEAIENPDLWEKVLRLCNKHRGKAKGGELLVQVVLIPQHLNDEADRLASAAAEGLASTEYSACDLNELERRDE